MTTQPPGDERTDAKAIKAMRVIVISDTPPPPLADGVTDDAGSADDSRSDATVSYVAPETSPDVAPLPDAGASDEEDELDISVDDGDESSPEVLATPPQPVVVAAAAEPAEAAEAVEAAEPSDPDVLVVEDEPSSPEPVADDELDIPLVESELSSPYGAVAPFEPAASVEPPRVADVPEVAERAVYVEPGWVADVLEVVERSEPADPDRGDESDDLDIPIVESELSSPYGAVAPFEPAASVEPPRVADVAAVAAVADVAEGGERDADPDATESYGSNDLDIAAAESEIPESEASAESPDSPSSDSAAEPQDEAAELSEPDAAEVPEASEAFETPTEAEASETPAVAEASETPTDAEASETPDAEDEVGDDAVVELLGDEDLATDLDDGVVLAVSPPPVASRPPGPPPRKLRPGAVTTRELPLPKKLAPEAPPAESSDTVRPQLWWQTLFSREFAGAVRPMSDAQVRREVDFIEESLEFAAGAELLDLACGGGRHAVDLAARGYVVTGVDYSPDQLESANALALRCKSAAGFSRVDMRELEYEEAFDGVISWNASFGYFEEDKNVDVLRRVYRALRPGGIFLIDVANRDYAMNEAPSSEWFEGNECVCMDEMEMDAITSRLRVRRTVMPDAGGMLNCYYTIRLYSLHELGKLLHSAGFRVTQASGHTATRGAFFGATSPRIIIRAQKRA